MRRVPVVLHTLAVFCVLLSLLVAPATLLAQDPLPPCGIEHYDLTDPDWLAGNPGGAYLGNTNTAPDPCPPDIFLVCNGIDTAAGHNGPDISSPPVSMWCGVPTFPPNKPGVNAGAACIGGDTRTVTLSTAGGDSFQISGSPGLGVVNGTSATFSGLQEGVGYQFQGIASNSSGSSGWSDPTPPVYHDLSAPVTSADVVGLGDGQMYRSEVSVALLANDTGCLGVVGTTYTLDGVTSPYSGVFSVRGEGTHTLSFASTDGVHSEAPQTLTLFIDVTPPRTTLTQNGNRVSASATDNLSGVSVTMYRLNGGEMQGWFAPLTLPGGNHRIEFASVDFAGNAEAWQTAYYSIPYGGGNVGSQGVDAPVTGGAPVRTSPDWSLWDEGVPTFPTTPRVPYLDGRRGGGEMNPPERYTPAVMPYVEGRRGGGSMNPPVRYVPAVEPERRGVGRGQTVWADDAPMGVPSVVASIPAGMDDRVSKAIAALSLAATVGAGAFSILEQKRKEQVERAAQNRAQNMAQRAAASQMVSVGATISDAEREYNRLKAERAALREQWLQAEAERLKAEEERRLKEEAARYAAYLAALRREQAARRANAARVRGARMEDEMMAAEEAEMANTRRQNWEAANLRRRESQEARVEGRLEGNDADWNADYVRRDQQSEIALAQNRMRVQQEAIEAARAREAAERAAIAAENTRQSREARVEQTAAAQEAAWATAQPTTSIIQIATTTLPQVNITMPSTTAPVALVQINDSNTRWIRRDVETPVLGFGFDPLTMQFTYPSNLPPVPPQSGEPFDWLSGLAGTWYGVADAFGYFDLTDGLMRAGNHPWGIFAGFAPPSPTTFDLDDAREFRHQQVGLLVAMAEGDVEDFQEGYGAGTAASAAAGALSLLYGGANLIKGIGSGPTAIRGLQGMNGAGALALAPNGGSLVIVNGQWVVVGAGQVIVAGRLAANGLLGLNDVFTLSSVNPPPQNTTPGGRIERNDCGGIRPCIDSQTGNNSKNAEILGQNLSNAGNPPPGPEGWAAHHIVQSTSTNSTWTRVRNWLADWFIDVNGAENGVWLTSQGLHNAIHSGNYMTWVHDMLARATSRAEAVEILELLRRAILSGSAKY